MPNLKNKKSRKFSHNFLDREAREEGRAREEDLYGDLLPYVIYLRRKGWVVFKEGLNYRIGTKLRDHWGLMDVYFRTKERESRALASQSGEVVDTPRPKRKAPRGDHARVGHTTGNGGRGADTRDQGQSPRSSDGQLDGVEQAAGGEA